MSDKISEAINEEITGFTTRLMKLLDYKNQAIIIEKNKHIGELTKEVVDLKTQLEKTPKIIRDFLEEYGGIIFDHTKEEELKELLDEVFKK